jgi:hypothetical protein
MVNMPMLLKMEEDVIETKGDFQTLQRGTQ